VVNTKVQYKRLPFVTSTTTPRPVYTPMSVVSLRPLHQMLPVLHTIHATPSRARMASQFFPLPLPSPTSPVFQFPILHLSDSCSGRGLNQSVVDEHGQAYVCGLQARDIEDRPDLDSWSSRISEDGTAPGTSTHHPRPSASFRLSSLRLNHSTWLILIGTCTVSIIFSTQAGHSSGRPTSTIRFMSES
jgi:hypothetical protein